MLGSFLEISIQTGEILASLDFYTRLGFARAPVNDIWPHPYAVLTDGNVYLGLHQYDFPSPSLTFVQPELRRQLPEFEALGIRFEFIKLGDDMFNEAGFYAPNRQMVTLLEARTYSPMPALRSEIACGYFDEYRAAAGDLPANCQFWEQLGLIRSETEVPATNYARYGTGGLNLCLCRQQLPNGPQLVFVHPQLRQLAEQLAGRGIACQPAGTGDVSELQLASPEGIQFLIRSGRN